MAQKLKSLPDSSWSLLHANASLIRGPTNLGRVHDLGQTYRRKEIELGATTVHYIISSSVIEPILLMEEIMNQLISHYLQCFFTSQVVQDFFHQQYYSVFHVSSYLFQMFLI